MRALGGHFKNRRSRIVIQHCFGITRTLRRCSRTGNWRFFCGDHRRQPLLWSSFLIFTVVAGLSSIYSAWWRGGTGGATPQAIQVMALPSAPSPTTRLDATLLLRYDGFYIRVVNANRITATGVNVAVLSWRVGAPAVDVHQDISVHNLPPGDESEFQVDLTPARSGREPDTEHLYSGYFVVTSSESSAPRMWAFSIPVDTLSIVARDGRWPLAEFDAGLPKPFLKCVDMPSGICASHGLAARRSSWSP
jgi:hypothetical protein